MDGENSNLYTDYIHARSIDSSNHESRNWVKALHGRIKHEIPTGWRISGENLYAKHSIHYKNLPGTYFLVFSIWDQNNVCQSWQDTQMYSEVMGLKTVPTFYSGTWNKENIEKAFEEYRSKSKDEVEGYVIRLSSAFNYNEYYRCTAKWVRKGHVQTSQFWMSEKIIPNELKK